MSGNNLVEKKRTPTTIKNMVKTRGTGRDRTKLKVQYLKRISRNTD